MELLVGAPGCLMARGGKMIDRGIDAVAEEVECATSADSRVDVALEPRWFVFAVDVGSSGFGGIKLDRVYLTPCLFRSSERWMARLGKNGEWPRSRGTYAEPAVTTTLEP